MMLWIANRADTLAADHNTYVSATTPGMVDTQLGRNSMSSVLWPLTKPLRMLLLRSPAEGALSAVAAGLVDGAVHGLYMDGVKELETLPQSRGERRGAWHCHIHLGVRALWTVTAFIVLVSFALTQMI